MCFSMILSLHFSIFWFIFLTLLILHLTLFYSPCQSFVNTSLWHLFHLSFLPELSRFKYPAVLPHLQFLFQFIIKYVWIPTFLYTQKKKSERSWTTLRRANLFIKDSLYNNTDAISNAIHYITHNNTCSLFCYGIWPPTAEGAVKKFTKLRNIIPKEPCSQQLQHFWITFEDKKCSESVSEFLDHLATSIGFYYPVCYAIHEDQSYLHAHFIVSTISYFSTIPFLINSQWRTCIDNIIQFAWGNNIDLKEIHKNA